MRTNRLIFSTRYLGDGYLFDGNCEKLKNDGKISLFLDEHFYKPELLKQCYCKFTTEQKEAFVHCMPDERGQNVGAEKYDYFIENDCSELTAHIKSLTNNSKNPSPEQLKKFCKENHIIPKDIEVQHCPSEIIGTEAKELKNRIESRYSYYKINEVEKDGNKYQAFAVPHLGWSDGKDWLNALINETSFGNKLAKEDSVYLILHDKDLLQYCATPFRVLSDKEIQELIENTDVQVNIIVFQHTSNDIVDVLTKRESINDAKQLHDYINGIITNKDKVVAFFEGLSAPCGKIRDFEGLSPDGDLDEAAIPFPKEKPFKDFSFEQSGKTGEGKSDSISKYFVYDDNGSVLLELMHSNLGLQSKDSAIRKLLTGGEGSQSEDKMNEGSQSKEDEMKFPLIIKLYLSFFKDWEKWVDENCEDETKKEKEKEKIKTHRNSMNIEKSLRQAISFLNNSSIWVRIVDRNDEDAYKAAEADFKQFKKWGLYDFGSAREYLNYNLRIQKENYLESAVDGHAHFVTPVLYGDEVASRGILKYNSKDF